MVLAKNRQTISTIVFLPYVGVFLFLIFGINRVERQTAGKLPARRSIDLNLPKLSQYQIIPGEGLNPQQEHLMRLAHRVAETLPTFGNKVELLVDTNRTLGLIEQAIHSAQQTLHIEYYIWQPDQTGTRLRDLLIEKASQGMTVRFLYDGIGSMRLSRHFLRPMLEAEIREASFLPGPSLRERWSLNLRSHRKIVIVDGQTSFTGGMNIGDEYLRKNPHLGYWRDTHLKLLGPVVLQLQQVFVENWHYTTGEELTQPEVFPDPVEAGDVSAQVLAGEPVRDIRVFHALMFAAINEARQQITLATSYFVPPAPLVTSLEMAACRGVRVCVLLAGKFEYLFTVLTARSYYDSLLRAGVENYEYEHGLLHSKTLTIDDN